MQTGFVDWCDACSWNLSASEPDAPSGRIERLYERAGARMGDRLARQLLAADSLEPRLTPAKLAAYAIAAVVHVLPLLFLVVGVALPVLAFPNVAAIVASVILLGLAWLMRPRLGEEPDEDVVTRAEAPELYRLADDVARALDTPTIDTLVIDHDFNATWSIVGVRRRRVLTLGLPLMEALEPQSKVALLGHELGHGRNGDVRRGFFVGSAVNALAELYYVFAPYDLPDFMGGDFGAVERAINFLFRVLSKPILVAAQPRAPPAAPRQPAGRVLRRRARGRRRRDGCGDRARGGAPALLDGERSRAASRAREPRRRSVRRAARCDLGRPGARARAPAARCAARARAAERVAPADGAAHRAARGPPSS